MAEHEKHHDAPPPSYSEQQQQPQMVYPGPAPGQQPGPQYQQPVFQQPLFQGQYGQPAFAQPGTTVIINQPVAGSPGGPPRLWATGICSCCDDVGICCCGLFFGTCLACKVANDMGESYCVPILVPAAEITLRTKWRTQENIQGSILDDCLTVWCCGPCAMCQLAREVKAKRNGTLSPPHQ